MSTTTQYVPRDFRRVCDECGVLYNRSRLHRKGPWILCDTCDEPGDRIREEEDAAIARQRPFRILPVPNAKPQNLLYPYDWQLEEAQTFNLVLTLAPSRVVGGASDVPTAAWAAGYLADIVTRGTRPMAWLASAKTKLASLLAYLLMQQYGSPTGPAATAADPRTGGFLASGFFLTSTVIAAGLAFVKGSAALGDASYLSAADRCATFLRRVQCGDLQTSQWTVFPAAGAPYHVGGMAVGVTDATGLQTQGFNLADVYALSFLAALAAVRGSSAIYGDAAATATFSAATAAPLSRMVSELVTFAEVGPMDSGAGGVTVSGLSATKPQTSYSSARNAGGGTASWTFSANVAGATLAQALAGLFAAVGADAVVLLMLQWMAATAPNAANATPATNSTQQTLNGITGAFSAATAPATSYTAAAPFTEATGALYDLAALGFLAPVLASTNAAQLKASRSVVAPGELFLVNDPGVRFPGTLGRLGLSLQPHTTATTTVPDVLLAAQFGNVFRYAIP